MSIFGYFIVIFIIIKLASYFIKQSQKETTSSTPHNDWESSYSQRLRSILKSCEGFDEDEIIDSAVGFYLFSYDNDRKEFIFIEDKGTIHWLSYKNLLEYRVRENKDYKINIDLKTTAPDQPYLSIECFNKDKLLMKMPQLQYRQNDVDSLYELERDKVDDIEDILQTILEEGKEISINDVPVPPPYIQKEEEVKVEEYEPETTSTTINIMDVITSVQDTKNEISEDIQEEVIIIEHETEIPEIIEENTSADIPEYISEPIQPIEILNNTPIEKKPVKDADGKIEVSLSEIEDYSRGKFLEYEVQSAVSDAKMRGKKVIYLTDEQLEKLKS
ncbi:hypothetical protein [Prevotella sp. 10(H)]|uniref:hypothetical protein n=1 Tax=Prevotella sp. 10(H) TaxID=1158294 RepID=UPI0004A6AA12|nr:hypothetical protein [Prevotella sp. 10(H)]